MLFDCRCTVLLLTDFALKILFTTKCATSEHIWIGNRHSKDVILQQPELPPIDEVLSSNDTSIAVPTYENATVLLPCSQSVQSKNFIS